MITASRSRLSFHIVGQQRIHVSQKELPVGDDGIGPARFAAAIGLVEPAGFFVSTGENPGQSQRAVFTAEIQVAVGDGEGTLAHGAVLPLDFALFPIETGEDIFIEAVDVTAEGDHAAVVVFHFVGVIDEGRFDVVFVGFEFDERSTYRAVSVLDGI